MAHHNNINIPANERYWTLVAKADKKFCKIRDLPYYDRSRYDTHFYKVFKVYTLLWKFQQENRQKLVESGLKRWEIGDIASRIGQLYFGQYMRTSDRGYLSESYIFYEAVLTREYFKDGVFQDLNLANKQMRFLARFLTVCLVLNRREMVYQLVNQLKTSVEECKRAFQETDFKEWKLVIQEIVKFLKADTAFMNIRPLRYSLVLDLHPDCLPHVPDAKRKLGLKDVILCSYHPNEVKFSELTLDTFRMLQCLEWEPSGSFLRSNGAGTNLGQDSAAGVNEFNYLHDIPDHTLPPNSRKAVLYRPSVTHFIAVLATICEELPLDGILLIYISALGSCVQTMSPPSCSATYIDNTENVTKSLESQNMYSDATSTSSSCSPCYHSAPLHIGARGDGGFNGIYPCDFIPFTRRPLFLVIDSDSSKAFKAINRAQKGEPVAMLLSPSSSPQTPTAGDSSRHQNGSLFTCFLTAPLQAFLILIGFSDSNIEMDKYNKADKLLSSLLDCWGVMLASSDTLDPVWAQVLTDPFLRRLLLRYIFCEAVLTLYGPTYNKEEYIPECLPCLPDAVLPRDIGSQMAVMQIADIFGATDSFIFTQGIALSPNRLTESCSISSSS